MVVILLVDIIGKQDYYETKYLVILYATSTGIRDNETSLEKSHPPKRR